MKHETSYVLNRLMASDVGVATAPRRRALWMLAELPRVRVTEDEFQALPVGGNNGFQFPVGTSWRYRINGTGPWVIATRVAATAPAILASVIYRPVVICAPWRERQFPVRWPARTRDFGAYA